MQTRFEKLTPLIVAAWTGILCFITQSARAQLSFGTNDSGGSGNWDTTTVDWFDGTNNVPWNNGDTATFEGAAGTVTVTKTFAIDASALTFNTGGYTITGNWFNSSTPTVTITANANAAISATFGAGGNASTLTKNGSGALTISGTNFYSNIQVNAGALQSSGTSDFFFNNVNLANAAGVTILLGGAFANESIGQLTGGGSAGGVVMPASTSQNKTLSVFGSGSFGGILADNGAAKLALTVYGTSGVETLTSANTYSGTTTVSGGALALSGAGSILNTSGLTVSGTLLLDNATQALASRVPSSLPVALNGGTVQMNGNASTAVAETLGSLNYSGASTVNVAQTGAATQLSFSGATRNSHATLDLPGTGGVTWSGAANGAGDIVAAYVTAGNEWATAGANGNVVPLGSYASGFSAGVTTDDVKISGGGPTSLSSSTTRNSLNLQNSSGSAGILDLGGNALTLTSGGLLTSGTSASQIQNGTISTSTGELVITNRNPLVISSVLAGTYLTKSGAGTLTLQTANTYSGATYLDAGILNVSSDSAMGTGSSIVFNGGVLQAGADFTTAKTLTNGSVDTNGHNLVLSAAISGSLYKIGAGTLTENSAATGSTTVAAGTLALPNAASGTSTLFGGTLLAAGKLDALILQAASTLDIGGAAAATLTTTSLQGSGSSRLTVNFGLGASASDLWTISSASGASFLPVVFNIQNLGGLKTGTNYELISAPLGAFNASQFSLSSADTSAGMTATFSTAAAPGQVDVNFTQLPEPGCGVLLFTGLGSLVGARRFRRKIRTQRTEDAV